MLMFALASASLVACGGKQSGGDTAAGGTSGGSATTLFASLGGEPAVKAVVKDFVEEEVAKDSRINAFFANTTDLPAFEQKLYDQICEAAGGPCKYTGKDMKTAHAGMHIKQADFDALVEDLVKTLDKFHVKDADKQALLGVLGPMKSDIVTAQ